MARVLRELPAVDNVAAGATATQRLPIGPTYDLIQLVYTGVTRAQINGIRVVVNGKVIQKFTEADRLQDINDYYGRPDTSGVVTLYFWRPEMDGVARQRLTALGTLDVQTAAIEIDIDAAAVGTTLKCLALQSEPAPLGLINKIKEFTAQPSVAGAFEVDQLVLGARVQAMHFYKSDITRVEIDADSVRVYEANKADAEALQKSYGRVPQTAVMTSVDWCLDGDQANAIITDRTVIQDLRIRPTVGAAGNVPIVVEYLDQFAGM
jgi:hypothetical protein